MSYAQILGGAFSTNMLANRTVTSVNQRRIKAQIVHLLPMEFRIVKTCAMWPIMHPFTWAFPSDPSSDLGGRGKGSDLPHYYPMYTPAGHQGTARAVTRHAAHHRFLHHSCTLSRSGAIAIV